MADRTAQGQITYFDVTDGVNGNDGSRGAGIWRINRNIDQPDPVPVPTNAEIATATGIADDEPITGDVAIVIYNNGSVAFSYSGTAWTMITEFIDGDLLVSGTVATDRLAAGTINSGVINVSSNGTNVGARTFIDSTGIRVFDENNILRVQIGDLN